YRRELNEKLYNLRTAEPGVEIEHRLEDGEPVEQIIRAAAQGQCDLIVMGTHGRTGFRRVLLGSVAEQVLRRAACPVLTVNTPAQETGMRALMQRRESTPVS